MPPLSILVHARTTPDKAALIHDGGSWSYAGFARRIVEARNVLAPSVPSLGGTALVCIGALPEAWVYALASRSLGLTTLVVTEVDSLDALPLDGEGCFISLESATPAVLAGIAVRKRWKSIRVPPTSGMLPASAETLTQCWSRAGDQIVMTSGTTGAYKLVRRDGAAEMASLDGLAAVYGLTASSVAHVGNFPLWTAGGYRWPLATWQVGGTVIIDQGVRPRLSYRNLHPTHLFATPATLAWLLGAPEDAWPRDDGMHLLVTAGALPRVLAEAAKKRLTRRISTALASTEASVLAMTPIESAEDLRWHRVLRSRIVEVVDDEGRVLPAGEVGHVRARVEDGVAGYVGDVATSRQFFRDGYFYPGDLGQLRDDGRLALHGRVNDVINVLGNKIATGPLEQSIQDRLGVEGVCILSLPGDGGDEEVHVAIQAPRAIARPQLEGIAKGELRAFPKVHFHVLARLPRNAMGKVVRAALRKVLQKA